MRAERRMAAAIGKFYNGNQHSMVAMEESQVVDLYQHLDFDADGRVTLPDLAAGCSALDLQFNAEEAQGAPRNTPPSLKRLPRVHGLAASTRSTREVYGRRCWALTRRARAGKCVDVVRAISALCIHARCPHACTGLRYRWRVPSKCTDCIAGRSLAVHAPQHGLLWKSNLGAVHLACRPTRRIRKRHRCKAAH